MYRPLRLILVTMLVATFAPSCVSQEVQPRATMVPENFELVLTADKEVYRVGEIPRFSATLINKSGKDVTIVLPTDGSSIGFRYPQFTYDITVPDDAVEVEQLGYCGNTNPLHPALFKTLRDSEELRLHNRFGGMGPAELGCGLRGPGEYTLQLTYSTDEPDIAAWLGGPLAPNDEARLRKAIEPLLADVPLVIVKSNVLHIRYEVQFDSMSDAILQGPPQPLYALNRLKSQAITEAERKALVKQLANYLPKPLDSEQNRFVREGMEILTTCATAKDAKRILKTVRPHYEADRRIDALSGGDQERELIQMMMALEPKDRLEAYTFLFTRQKYLNGAGTPIDPGRRELEPLFANDAEDISVALLRIHANLHPARPTRELIEHELQRRGVL